MKSDVETLDPTRVRLTVEVPFEELKPSLDAAYKKVAQQVRIPGFRPGKVPAAIIDQRFGRGVVLEEAINDAVPRFYGRAVEEGQVKVLGQPEIDVTELEDGQFLKFTAEVDVRPEIELPDYEGLQISVDDAEPTDTEVDEQVEALRDRFAVLTGVERAAAAGDFVSIDLSAAVDGEPIEDATASGMSYEVGKENLLDGLDEAVTGLAAGESATFATTLAGGELSGTAADVTVTVKTVKAKEVPPLDDDFAQTASEFDTLDELRADVRERLERAKRLQQGAQASDKALEALLERVEVPLPDKTVESEVHWRQHALAEQLETYGISKEDYLRMENTSEEVHDAELDADVRNNLRAQFVLDAVAQREELTVVDADLSTHIVRRAQRAGVSPDAYAQQIMQNGQVPMLVGEILRSKALGRVVERAVVTDASGRAVNLVGLREDGTIAAPEAEATTDSDVETTDASDSE